MSFGRIIDPPPVFDLNFTEGGQAKKGVSYLSGRGIYIYISDAVVCAHHDNIA